jgi:isocitrate lyase
MQDEIKTFQNEVKAVEEFFKLPRFDRTKRPYTAADVVSKRGTIQQKYASDLTAQKLHKLLQTKARGEGGGCSFTYGA